MRRTAATNSRKLRTVFEYSAGGVATEDGKFLLVQVRNLQGRVLWTFPKGHIDPGETPRQAALREVREETGYACEILGSLAVVRYFFVRRNQRISKKVQWYWMKPLSKPGSHDTEEILDVAWAAPEAARRQLQYPGDFKLLDLVLRRLESGREAAGKK